MRSVRLAKLAILTALTALSAAFAAPCTAAENAGNVIAARRLAWAERGPQTGLLVSKSPVFMGDTLATNPAGRLQVLFRDDSILMMAPDSKATVTEYVYGHGKKPAFALNLAQGVTRLISGRITEADPGAMRVETAHAIVGIKGTDVRITARGDETTVTLIQGSGGALAVFSKIHNATFPLAEPGTSLILTKGDTSTPAPVRRPMAGSGEGPLPLGNNGAADASGPTSGPASGPDTSGQAASGPASDPAASGPASNLTAEGPDAPSAGFSPSGIMDAMVVDTASSLDIARPALPGLPDPDGPPLPALSFNGRYSGDLAGTVAGTAVTGNFHLGVKDIAETPTVSAVSLFASEKGWAEGAVQALSIYGEGTIAALNADGGFAFTAQAVQTPAKLDANGLEASMLGGAGGQGYFGGSVTVSGTIADQGINLGLIGSLVGGAPTVFISGAGGLTAPVPPSPGELPVPPAIAAPVFTGTYAGMLDATLGGAAALEPFTMGIADLGRTPAVTFMEAGSDAGYSPLRMYGYGDVARLDGSGNFSFRAGNESNPVYLANGGPGGYIDFTGSVQGNGVTMQFNGIADSLAVSGTGTGTKVSDTPPVP